MEEGLPSIDFATFVLSLNHSALLHLGEAPDLESGKREKNLPIRVRLDTKSRGKPAESGPFGCYSVVELRRPQVK